jgi:hypothetical protein
LAPCLFFFFLIFLFFFFLSTWLPTSELSLGEIEEKEEDTTGENVKVQHEVDFIRVRGFHSKYQENSISPEWKTTIPVTL